MGGMKICPKLLIVAVLCMALAGCSQTQPSPPAPEKVRAALDKVIKKDNPDASYSITSTDVHASGTLVSVKVSFENFKFKGEDGKDRDFPSGKATASIDHKDGKWVLDTFQTSEPEIVLLLPRLPVE